MPEAPWWRRWGGLPWDNKPDAEARTSFFSRDLSTKVATLAIPLVGLPIGYAVFLATKDAWLAALVWATIGIVLACGSYLLWRNLRRDL